MSFLPGKPKAYPCSNFKLDIAEILLYPPLITWITYNNAPFWWDGQPLFFFFFNFSLFLTLLEPLGLSPPQFSLTVCLPCVHFSDFDLHPTSLEPDGWRPFLWGVELWSGFS